jgi:hypothetical protein
MVRGINKAAILEDDQDRSRLFTGRDRREAYGRNLVAYLARKLAGFGVKEIAQHFKREPMTISLGIKRSKTSSSQIRIFLRELKSWR